MHICHINLARGFRGGERQTLLLIKGLSKRNIKQSLICRKNDRLAEKANELDSLNIVSIDKPFLFNSLNTKHCDLMHAHEGRASHFAFYSHLATKRPYVISRRIPNIPKSSAPTTFVYKSAEKIIALSHAIKSNLLNYHNELDIDVIPSMCSDLTTNQSNVDQLRRKYQGKTLIGHIGALVNHHKGQQTIIHAARELAISHPNMHFLLLGDGRDEVWLKEQASLLSNVEFVGFVDNVGDYLKLFDLFVFPSNEEGFGSILLDAMQFRVPIIASKVDGIPDFIEHRKNGLLIEPGSSRQLVDSIIELSGNKILQEKLVQQGEKTVEKHSADLIAAAYLEVYHQLLPQYKRNPYLWHRKLHI